jgi:hypothetical protein
MGASKRLFFSMCVSILMTPPLLFFIQSSGSGKVHDNDNSIRIKDDLFQKKLHLVYCGVIKEI